MKVKNLILYQVATDRNYKVGDIIKFGEELNGQGNRVYCSNFKSNNLPIYKHGFEYADSKKFLKNKKLIIQLSKALNEHDFILRELATEEVRKEKFPNLPSRMKCMFLLDDKEKVIKLVKEMRKTKKRSYLQAVAVKLNGEVFYAKEVGLPRNGLSFNEYKEIAYSYWAQNQKSKEETKEILFEGAAEIVEILEEVGMWLFLVLLLLKNTDLVRCFLPIVTASWYFNIVVKI